MATKFKVEYVAIIKNGMRIEGTRTLTAKDEAQAAISLEKRIRRERGEAIDSVEIDKVTEVVDDGKDVGPGSDGCDSGSGQPGEGDGSGEDQEAEPEDEQSDMAEPSGPQAPDERKQRTPEDVSTISRQVRTASLIAAIDKCIVTEDLKKHTKALKVTFVVSGSQLPRVLESMKKFEDDELLIVNMEAAQKTVQDYLEGSDHGQTTIPGTERIGTGEDDEDEDEASPVEPEVDPQEPQDGDGPSEVEDPPATGEGSVSEEEAPAEDGATEPGDQPASEAGIDTPSGPLTFQFFHVNGLDEYWYSPDHDEWWLKSKDGSFTRTDEKDAIENRKRTV